MIELSSVSQQVSSHSLISHEEWTLHIQGQFILQYHMLGTYNGGGLLPLFPTCVISREQTALAPV